jgi:hypothetical protein
MLQVNTNLIISTSVTNCPSPSKKHARQTDEDQKGGCRVSFNEGQGAVARG